MRGKKYLFTALLLAALALSGAALVHAGGDGRRQEEDGLVVAASFYPMYIAAENVAGEIPGVTVENMTQPQAGCLHDYQLTPDDLVLLSGADVFVVNGGGIESFLEDVADQYPDLSVITASEGIDMLDAVSGAAELKDDEEDSHAHEHSHGSQNAHVWMDVGRYMQEVENIRDGLIQADPEHQEAYEANAQEYLGKLEALRVRMEELKEKAQQEKIMIFHEAFAYLGEALGLNVRGIVNMDENTSLSAHMISQVIGLIHSEDIDMLFAEERYGTEIADAVARETAAHVYMLDALVAGDEDADSYLEGMEYNIRILEEALGQ